MAKAQPDLLKLSRLVDANASQQRRIEEQLTRAVTRELSSFQGWYKPDAVNRMSERVGRHAEIASRQAAATTDAYHTQVLGELFGGQQPNSRGVIDLDRSLRNGVDTWAEVYKRPAETYRYLESIGWPEDEALAGAIERADAQARTDVALARRNQSQDSLQAAGSRIIGYRRIIRPEASVSGSCGLCIVASQNKYYVEDLLPIHDRCKCEVMAITADHDPGVLLNDGDLGELYEAAGVTGSWDLKELRVKFEEHGELGPVIVDARHRTKNAGVGRGRYPRELAGADMVPLPPAVVDPYGHLEPGNIVNQYAWGYGKDGGPLYLELNFYMRDGLYGTDPHKDRAIRLLQSQIEKDGVKPPDVLHRAMAHPGSSDPFWRARGNGGFVVEPGFMSTSSDRDVVLDFAGAALNDEDVTYLRIIPDKDVKALQVLTDGYDQKEWLFPPGVKFEVLGGLTRFDGAASFTVRAYMPKS